MKNEARVAGRQRSKAFARATLLAAALVGPAAPLGAQGVLKADPADVESVDAIIAALYDVISGPAGQERDWNRFRSLFLPGAHLVPTVLTPDGSIRYVVWSPEDYVTRAGPQLEEVGFFEAEISRVAERFGNIAHIFTPQSIQPRTAPRHVRVQRICSGKLNSTRSSQMMIARRQLPAVALTQTFHSLAY